MIFLQKKKSKLLQNLKYSDNLNVTVEKSQKWMNYWKNFVHYDFFYDKDFILIVRFSYRNMNFNCVKIQLYNLRLSYLGM